MLSQHYLFFAHHKCLYMYDLVKKAYNFFWILLVCRKEKYNRK